MTPPPTMKVLTRREQREATNAPADKELPDDEASTPGKPGKKKGKPGAKAKAKGKAKASAKAKAKAKQANTKSTGCGRGGRGGRGRGRGRGRGKPAEVVDLESEGKPSPRPVQEASDAEEPGKIEVKKRPAAKAHATKDKKNGKGVAAAEPAKKKKKVPGVAKERRTFAGRRSPETEGPAKLRFESLKETFFNHIAPVLDSPSIYEAGAFSVFIFGHLTP